MVAQPGPRHPASQTHAPPTHPPVSEQLRSLVHTHTAGGAFGSKDAEGEVAQHCGGNSESPWGPRVNPRPGPSFRCFLAVHAHGRRGLRYNEVWK